MIAGLENIARTAADSRQEGRYVARAVARSLPNRGSRFMSCGHALGGLVRAAAPIPDVSGSGVNGLETCGSVWACPVCAAKIAHVRTNDLEAGIVAHAESGSFALLTLTMRHHKGQGLADLWNGISDAWRRFVSHRTYKEARKSLGVIGYHRTTEVTYGAHGWHVHLHVLMFREAPGASDIQSVTDASALVSLWLRSVSAGGFSATVDGQDWKLLHGSADSLKAVAGYMTKAGYHEGVSSPRSSRQIAMEVKRGDLKEGRNGSRTPFQVLRDLVEGIVMTGEMDSSDLAVWEEFELVSKGRRQQVWSRGLRDRLGLDAELTDEEAAAVDVEGQEVVEITAAEWRRFVRDPYAHGRLLAAMDETAGQGFMAARAAAMAVLIQAGIEFRALDPGER